METSSPSLPAALHSSLDNALAGFISEPTEQETRNAIYSALATLIEVQARALLNDSLRVKNVDGKVTVTLEGPLAHVLRDLFGLDAFGMFQEDYEVTLPGCVKSAPPEPTSPVQRTRTYIDPRTNRPSRGRPML